MISFAITAWATTRYPSATQGIVVVNVTGNTICNLTGDSGESKDTSQGSTTENNTTALSTLTPSNSDHVCLLRTATATVTTTDSEAEANILFDGRLSALLSHTRFSEPTIIMQESGHSSFLL